MKKNWVCLFASIIVWMLFCARSYAVDVNDFTFRHLSYAEGLCSQRIYSIKQTEDGAIWWAAKNCVERYNGVSVKCYKLDAPEDFSYQAGRYIKLFLSSDNTLFAFDNKGEIFVYNSRQDKFSLFADIRAIVGDGIILNDIHVDKSGIWLATGSGICLYRSGEVQEIIPSIEVNSIVEVDKRLFFCTREGLVECRETDGSERFFIKKLVDVNVVCGYFDEDNRRLWLGCFTDGVKVISFANNGKALSVTSLSAPQSINKNPVRAICAYDKETILVGVDGKGVFKAVRHPDISGNYEADLLFDANNGKNGVLNGNGVYALICDTWGNVVVGSYSGGVDIAHPVGMASKIFRHQRNNSQSVLNDHVNCVAQLPDGKLVMGTDNGVSIYDADNNFWTHASNGYVVIDLCVWGRQGRLLAATYGGGVIEISQDGTSRQLYSVANGVLKDDHVYCIYQDGEGGLWLGCLDGPLVFLNEGNASYYDIKNVQDILQLPDGRIAVGTVNGIFLIDKSSTEVQVLDYGSSRWPEVSRYVYDIYLQGEDKLWIGTDGGGLYVHDLDSGECRMFLTSDGLPSNTILSICEDAFGRILISTDYGLAYIDEEISGKVVDVNYGHDVDREYVSRAVTDLKNGHILYGTTTGAIIVNPENLKEQNFDSNLQILRVSGVGADEDLCDRISEMLAGGELSLKYRHRTFDLVFECINLSNQYDIMYQYKVDDGEWGDPTYMQSIRFSSLEHGYHHLYLRCVSRSSGVVLDEEHLNIRISRPWWNSWWMWTIYVMLIVVAFYIFWYFYQLHIQYMRLAVNNPNLISVTLPGKLIVDNIRSRSAKPDEGKEFVDKVTSCIVNNLSDNNFNIDQLCHEVAMSRTMFYLKLKAYTGKSPQDFIKVIRMERAAALLRSGKSVSEVADMTGFDNPKYFSTVFKKYFGVSPSKYR